MLVVGLFFTSLPFTKRTHYCRRRIALPQGHRFVAANKCLVSLPDLLFTNGKEMRSSPARRRLSSYRGGGPATPQLVGVVSGGCDVDGVEEDVEVGVIVFHTAGSKGEETKARVGYEDNRIQTDVL
nr:hypothetical protein Iba_chr07bCG5410 [Ipomoea batatas]